MVIIVCRSFVLGIVFILFHFVASAQNNEESFVHLKSVLSQQYGLDPILNNGRYFYPKLNIVDGFPFWKTDSLLAGTIYVNGVSKYNQLFKYDLVSQGIVLNVKDRFIVDHFVMLNSEVVDSFRIGNAIFIKNHFPEIDNRFVQVIHEGKISCYLSWYVVQSFNSTGDKIGFIYLDNDFRIYLLDKENLILIKKRKDLFHLFGHDKANELKKMMKRNKIRWKTMNVDQLKLLVLECEQ